MSDQRAAFIAAIIDGQLSMAAACRTFGISRPTGYKLLTRYQERGPDGLADLSRTPHHCPNAVSGQIRDAVIGLRAKHPTWGARKIKVNLARCEPDTRWPAASTIGDLLKDAGLVGARRLRKGRHGAELGSSLSAANAANQVWCADYKGQFPCGDGVLCYPLTTSDLSSRFLVRCQALTGTGFELAQPVFVGAFQEFGLPDVIRTDNGPPFATNGIISVSRLSLWWLKLGIRHERIQPGRPQQNGVHERMHRTLKADCLQPPAASMKLQQRRFDEHRQTFNQERPHEALGMCTPASCFSASPRSYPLAKLAPFEYPETMLVRHVRTNGCMRWRNGLVYVSSVLCGEYVGLEPIEDDLSIIYVGSMPVAVLDQKQSTLLPTKRAQPKIKARASDQGKKV